MPSYLSLAPVSAAVFTTLNVAALTGLLATQAGGQSSIADFVFQGMAFPYLFFEVHETRQLGWMGTKPGVKSLPEVDLRLHAFWTTPGKVDGQTILAEALALLFAGNALSVSGYAVCGTDPFHDTTIDLGNQVVAGVVVNELVSQLRLYVEEL